MKLITDIMNRIAMTTRFHHLTTKHGMVFTASLELVVYLVRFLSLSCTEGKHALCVCNQLKLTLAVLYKMQAFTAKFTFYNQNNADVLMLSSKMNCELEIRGM